MLGDLRQSTPRSRSRPIAVRSHRTSFRFSTPATQQSAFTLVEMLVVVAIIVIVVALSLPAVTTLWSERKISDTEGRIEGLLMTARSRAVGSAEGQHGLLVFLDDKGTQHMVPIAQATVPEQLPCSSPPLTGDIVQVCRDAHALVYQDVFTVQPGRQVLLPPPLRVVPRYVVVPDTSSPSDDVLTFSNAELVNRQWTPLPTGNNQAQRHRNYFVMIFSADGQLLDRRDALIQDFDDDRDGRGDLTGLPSSYDHANDKALVTHYYDKSDDKRLPLDRTGGLDYTVTIPFLVVEASGSGASAAQQATAINFPAVDGLLLYDDAEFQTVASSDAATARTFLLQTGRPLYVNRVTGAIIRGPVGEGASVP